MYCTVLCGSAEGMDQRSGYMIKNMDTVASKRVSSRATRCGTVRIPRKAPFVRRLQGCLFRGEPSTTTKASAVPGSHAVTLTPKPLSLSILSVLMSAALLLSRTAPCASELTFSQRDLPALRVVSVTGRWDE